MEKLMVTAIVLGALLVSFLSGALFAWLGLRRLMKSMRMSAPRKRATLAEM